MFVLDDGWFGKRDADNSSLGDWFEYEGKLTNGLREIADYAHSKGLKFGLWFEPEMIRLILNCIEHILIFLCRSQVECLLLPDHNMYWILQG